VADRLGEQAVGVERAPFAALVLSAEREPLWPRDGREQTRERKAALLQRNAALGEADLRVGKHELGAGVLAHRQIDGGEPDVDTDLRSSYAEAGRLPAGFEKICDDLLQLFTEVRDRLAR